MRKKALTLPPGDMRERARISLNIGVISVGISLFFGLTMGIIAGYYGGVIDNIIMRLIDIMLAVPSIMLAIVIVAILGPSLNNAIIAIGIVGIPVYARLIRASLIDIKENEYVVASKLNGAGTLRMIFYVMLPNCINPIIVQSTMGPNTRMGCYACLFYGFYSDCTMVNSISWTCDFYNSDGF